MYPYLFEIFGRPIGTFGVMMATGFLVGIYLIDRELKRLCINELDASQMGIAAMVGGVVGAKLYFLLEHLSDVSADPMGMIFSGSGLTWYGGLLGGFLAVVWVVMKARVPVWKAADVVAPSLAIGQAFGRVGCQLAGDGDYGVPTDLPWGMAYPNGIVPTIEKVHPAPVYEMLALTVVFFVLWRLRLRPHQQGFVFALYLILGGAQRFLVEFVRHNGELALHLTTAQWISAAMILGGLIMLRRRPESAGAA